MPLIDAHVHLPDYADPLKTISGFQGMCLFSCTVRAAQAESNLRLQQKANGSVKCFFGVHPSDVSEELPSAQLSSLVSGCDGIGEVGLDPKYSDAGPRSMQMSAFLDQLAMAETLGKPVQIHSRGAEQICLDSLSTFRLPSVLMHWFEGEERPLELAVSRGYYFSFGPALLYSKKMMRIAERVPRERLLTESDGPVPFNPLGGASGPNLIASVLFRLAELRGLSFEEAERLVDTNARAYLGAERLI